MRARHSKDRGEKGTDTGSKDWHMITRISYRDKELDTGDEQVPAGERGTGASRTVRNRYQWENKEQVQAT